MSIDFDLVKHIFIGIVALIALFHPLCVKTVLIGILAVCVYKIVKNIRKKKE